MHWVLQSFEDTEKLAMVLARMGQSFSRHKVVPFVGELDPDLPKDVTHGPVILFGSYTLWRYAQAKGLRPGVFRVRPFLGEAPWRPFLLNADPQVMALRDVPDRLRRTDRAWFFRPVSDSKEVTGRVRTESELVAIADKVLALPEADIPKGSLRPETQVFLAPPHKIQTEWRVWIVQDRVVTWSLYREGPRVTYRAEIDEDALDLAKRLVGANPGYAPAYVMDICRTKDGVFLLETNCLNAAGIYAGDISRLAQALVRAFGEDPD